MVDKIKRHVYLSGKVQGVGFRAFIRKKANELGVKGWVKNLYDGRVEAVFVGEAEDVETMIEFVKEGPRFANVNNIRVLEEDYEGRFDSFEIKF
ncbi:MAG: acylphosphatase [Halanaerobiales bacterium]